MEPCPKLLTENAPLGFTTATARFFRAKVLAAGDGLDEDDTLVIAHGPMARGLAQLPARLVFGGKVL